METYSITSSSSQRHHIYAPRNLQYTIPAEAEQMNTDEVKFSATRSYLQNTSPIGSSGWLHDELMETKKNSSAGDHSGITSENTSLRMISCAATDIGSHKNGRKEAMDVEDGEDGDLGQEEGIKNGVSGGKKIKAVEKKVRRPRFAFQTRSQVDILDDGYRWRKYGQKAVKNNNFPRSYYRCTHQGCNVKKQVQRLSKDEEVVVTTYEGTHTHPIERNTDNFEQILKQMQIYTTF